MLKTVSRHLTGIDAHIIRTRLEAEDIPAFINTEHYIGLDWSLALALDYIKVQVPYNYFDDAKQVLDNIDQGIYQAELEAELGSEAFEQPGCPKCGEHQITPVTWPAKLSLFSIFLLIALPLPYTQHLKRCTSCNHRWIAHEERAYPLFIPTSYILIWAAIITAVILAISAPLDNYAVYDDGFEYNDDGSYERPIE